MSASPGGGELVVCATPIGNLADVTLRVLATLSAADVLACEDTRHSRVLLEHHAIDMPELVSYHEHNEQGRTAGLVSRMCQGATVALLSDAGMPLISDPGFQLVRASIEASLPVRVLPGASSVLCALVASGLPVERFRFVGFLPRKGQELKRILNYTPETLVAFESPRRLVGTLQLLAEHDRTRAVAVCRELTKMHEEIRRGAAGEVADYYREAPPRGEVVLVVHGAPAQAAEIDDALAALRSVTEAGARARPAAVAIAKLTGLSANQLYRELKL